MQDLSLNLRDLWGSFEGIVALLGLIIAIVSTIGSITLQRFYKNSLEKETEQKVESVVASQIRIDTNKNINTEGVPLEQHTAADYLSQKKNVNNTILENAIKEIFRELKNELKRQEKVANGFKILDNIIVFFEYILLVLLSSGFFLNIISTFFAGIMGLILLVFKQVKRAFQIKARALKAAENANLLNRIISVVGTQITFLEANSAYAIEREKILIDAREALDRVRDKMLNDEFVLHQERLLEEKKQEIEKASISNNQRNRKKRAKN